MGENTMNYREEIQKLENESRELDVVINKAKEKRESLESLQGELERQKGIKSFIEEMEQKGKLIADKIPGNAKFLMYSKVPVGNTVKVSQKQVSRESSVSTELNKPINIALIVLSVIIMICSFGAWLSFAGYDLNLMTGIKGLNTLSSWGAGEYVDKYKWALWVLIISIWVVGINSAFIIYKILKGSSIKGNAIGGTVWSIFLVVMLTGLSKYIASQSYGWLSVQINAKAYITILLTIVVSVLAFQRKTAGKDIIDSGTAARLNVQEKESTYIIKNSYPWMNIQLVSGIIKTGDKTEFSASYIYKGLPVEEICREKMGSSVKLITDLVIETAGNIYAVKDLELQINSLEKKGKTESIYLDVNVGQVQSLKVFVKAVVVEGEEKVPACGFHVVGEMA